MQRSKRILFGFFMLVVFLRSGKIYSMSSLSQYDLDSGLKDKIARYNLDGDFGVPEAVGSFRPDDELGREHIPTDDTALEDRQQIHAFEGLEPVGVGASKTDEHPEKSVHDVGRCPAIRRPFVE